MRPPNIERAAPAGSGNGSQKSIGLGGTIKEQDGFCQSNSQVLCGGVFWRPTPRWNSLSLDKPLRRWEIPADILTLAAREPLKAGWWESRHHRPRPPVNLSTGKQSDRGRIYTRAERAAFVVSSTRPESDWHWWFRHAERCAYWAIHDSFRGYQWRAAT